MAKSSIPSFDVDLTSKVKLKYGKHEVAFQYPPIITSDNKGADWKSIKSWGPEPIVYYTGAKERDISMEWAYIVTNENFGNHKWDIATISKEVKMLRGYFYVAAGQGDNVKSLIVGLNAYDIIGTSGSDQWSFRFSDIGVTHSNTLIKDGDKIYPLKTEIKAKIKLWTTANIGGRQPEAGEAKEDMEKSTKIKNELAIQLGKDLKDNPTSVEWY